LAWRQGQAILSAKWVTAKTKNQFLQRSLEKIIFTALLLSMKSYL